MNNVFDTINTLRSQIVEFMDDDDADIIVRLDATSAIHGDVLLFAVFVGGYYLFWAVESLDFEGKGRCTFEAQVMERVRSMVLAGVDTI